MIWDAFRNVPADIMRYMALNASMDDAEANSQLRQQQLADMQRKNEATQAIGEILKQGPQMVPQKATTPNENYISPENQQTMEMAGYAPKFDTEPQTVTTTQRPEAMHEMLQRAGTAVMSKDVGTGLSMIKEGRAQLDDQLSQIAKMAKVNPDAAVRMFNENPSLGGMFGPMRKIGEDGDWTMHMNESLGVYRINKKTGQIIREESGRPKSTYWDHMQRAVVGGDPDSRAILAEDERRRTAEKLAEYHGKRAAEAPEKQWKSEFDVSKARADWVAKMKGSDMKYKIGKPEYRAQVDKELEAKAKEVFPSYKGEGPDASMLRLPDGAVWDGDRPPTKEEKKAIIQSINNTTKNVNNAQATGTPLPSPTSIKGKTDAARQKANAATPEELEAAFVAIGGDRRDPKVQEKVKAYIRQKKQEGNK